MMTPELVTAAMKMIGVLVLIVGGLLAFNAYSKRFFKNGLGAAGHKAVRVLENTPLGIKKSIALVRVPGAVLVLLPRGQGRERSQSVLFLREKKADEEVWTG